MENGNISTVPLAAAARLTIAGVQFAQGQERWQDAVNLFNVFFSHPRSARLNAAASIALFSAQMRCCFQIGDEVRAAEAGRLLLRIPEKDNPFARHTLCLVLLVFIRCSKLCTDAKEAAREFTCLVADTVRVIDPEYSLEDVPEVATYGQLAPLLTSALEKVSEEIRTKDPFRRNKSAR